MLEDRLAPAGLLNGDFAISNPSDPNYGWTTKGNATISHGQGILNEGTTVQTEFSQSFTIAPGTTALRFTIVASDLASNGPNNPPDAVEAALLNTSTNQPLVGPATGLANSDAFLNIQQDGHTYYAPQVTVPGAGASGTVASIGYPELITVDLSSVPANTQATLFFDLIGFPPASSSVRITSVMALQGVGPPPVSFTLDSATDSGIKGDDLTNFNPVNLVGATEPNQTVMLAIGSDGFTDGTTTADASGHFSFTGVHLAEGANLVRVQATNAQGSTTASQTITIDTQPPTGTLVTPTPGTATNSDLGYVDIQWASHGAAVIDPTTYGTGNVTIAGVTIQQVQDLGNNLERYLYNLNVNTLPLGKVNVVLVGGQVADTAANVNAQTTQSFTLVAPTILFPIANAQSVTTAQETAHAIRLTGSDPNTPPLSLTFAVTANPAHGTLSGAAPDLTYTPAAGYFGPDSFQFKVSNGSLASSPATISIAVVGRPSGIAQSVSTAQGIALPITLTGTDPNTPPVALSFQVTVSPAHGTLSGTAPNVTYTPAAGYSGPDSFQFTVGNGVAASVPATISISVTSTTGTQPPVSVDDFYTTVQNRPLVAAAPGVLANDNGFGALLTADLVAGPAHGSLVFHADGSFVYTTAANYNGSDTFTYASAAGALEGNVAVVHLTVTPVPVRLVPDTPYFRYIRHKWHVDPIRFGTYHPQIGAILTLEKNGLPTAPTTLVLPNRHFNAVAERRQYAQDPQGYDERQPILGALFQLEQAAPGPQPRHLLPETTRFNALRALYARDPALVQRQNVYFAAILALENIENGVGSSLPPTAAKAP
jgi:hypothetical protein